MTNTIRPRKHRARFTLRVEWGKIKMGTRRDLLAEFDEYVEAADEDGLTAAFLYRDGCVIREWRR